MVLRTFWLIITGFAVCFIIFFKLVITGAVRFFKAAAFFLTIILDIFAAALIRIIALFITSVIIMRIAGKTGVRPLVTAVSVLI